MSATYVHSPLEPPAMLQASSLTAAMHFTTVEPMSMPPPPPPPMHLPSHDTWLLGSFVVQFELLTVVPVEDLHSTARVWVPVVPHSVAEQASHADVVHVYDEHELSAVVLPSVKPSVAGQVVSE